MPCTDCTRINVEFGCLKELMRGWFTIVNEKLSGLEDGQKLLISRFDKQDKISAKGSQGQYKVASFAVDRNIVQNDSSFAAILPVQSAVNEDENAIIPISASNSARNPEPIAAAANNVILSPVSDKRQTMTHDFSASENLDDFQISFSLVEPQPGSSVRSQYTSAQNANIDEHRRGVKTEQPLLQQSTDKQANLSISSGLLGFQINLSPYVNVHNILNDLQDTAPYLSKSFMQAENPTVTNKRNVAEKQMQSNSVEAVLKTQRRFSKRHDGKKVVYTDREAKRSKTEENDTAINEETSCPTSNENKCNRFCSSIGDKHFQCGYCNRKFNQKCNLVTHVRLHTGEYPYHCNYCKKKFTRKVGLIKHERLHTGEKPFQCNYCKKKFTQKSHLVSHVRVHTGETPYKCNYCEKKFSQKGCLIKHERLHTSEKPFQCNYCKKKFSQNGHLRSHVRLHTGEKPYQCNYCLKKFSQSSHLLTHIRSHTGGKPYQCNHCEERFSQKAHLVTHENLQHYK